jgi:hypothetical protein
VESDSNRKYEDYHCKPDEHAAQFCVHLSLESSGPQWRFQITGRELSAADEDSPLLFFFARLDRPSYAKDIQSIFLLDSCCGAVFAVRDDQST